MQFLFISFSYLEFSLSVKAYCFAIRNFKQNLLTIKLIKKKKNTIPRIPVPAPISKIFCSVPIFLANS